MPLDADAVSALGDVKIIMGADHVAAVSRKIGAPHFRTEIIPQDGAIVGVQPKENPVSLDIKTPVDRDGGWLRGPRSGMGRGPGSPTKERRDLPKRVRPDYRRNYRHLRIDDSNLPIRVRYRAVQ